MVLLDDLGGMIGGNAGAGGALNDLLAKSGGLDGLLAQFNQAGLGDIIKGWIATGPNPGVAPGQLEQVFGAGKLQELAKQFGLPLDDLLGGLSSALPKAVDGLTPDGTIPPGGGAGQIGDILGQIFGKS